MAIRVAINGFGRIGRMVFRRAQAFDDIQIVAVNASYPAETLAHLVKYDSVHGIWEKEITAEGDALVVEGQRTQLVSERDPSRLPWRDLNIDVVVEATGKFRDREGAGLHLGAGAKKVLITAPGKDEDFTLVMGVNHNAYDPERHHIVSNASCTTTCLAPVAKVLHDAFGIREGLMTTVHSFTNDQRSLDNPHKDLRRARASGQSIVPTTTGAAKAVAKVLPELKGKLNGLALRVPTPNVSVVDLVVDLEKPATAEEVNRVLREAAETTMKGYIQYTEDPLVSVDFVGNPHSAIVDGLSTMAIGESKVKVLAWYDNEWGYSCRVVEAVRHIARHLAGGAADAEKTTVASAGVR